MGIMQCHLLQPGIIYVNHAMPSCLASHHICELYCAILFSIMYSICQQCLYIHLLFLCISHLESVTGKSGVKTRSSEQSVLPVDADFLLVTDSSSEEDSERDDQSYPPPRGACSNLAGLYCSYHAYGVLHCHAICLDQTCFV